MITVYSSKTCGPCNQLKQYLKYKGFEFVDKDIEDEKNARVAYRLAGRQQVPVTTIDNHVIVGYNLSYLNRLLEIR